MMRILFIVLFMLIFCSNAAHAVGLGVTESIPDEGPETPCTDGVDCVCDTIASTLPPGTNLLFCEDFDNPNYYGGVIDAGTGQLQDGYWVDESSPGCSASTPNPQRGYCGDFKQRYGSFTDGSLVYKDWPIKFFGFVKLGINCDSGYNQGTCISPREWCSYRQGLEAGLPPDLAEDCWQYNRLNPSIDIMKYDSDFYAEVSYLKPPKKPNAVGIDGVISGNHLMARRIGNRLNATNALGGGKGFTLTLNLGMTKLVAYASNIVESRLLTAPWKHDEFNGRDSGGGTQYPGDGLFLFSSTGLDLQGGTPPVDFPFQQIISMGSGQPCAIDNGQGGTTVSPGLELPNSGPIGNIYCTSTPKLRMHADQSVYKQSVDWSDLNEWRCVRIRYKVNPSDSNDLCVTEWVHDGVQEKVIIDFCGINISRIQASGGWDSFFWNAYSNKNQPSTSSESTTQVTYRYQDNFIITDGDPVPCDSNINW